MNVIEKMVLSTLQQMGAERLEFAERELMYSDLTKVYGKAALDFVVEKLSVKARKIILKALSLQEERDAALRSLADIIPDYEKEIEQALLLIQAATLKIYHKEVKRRVAA